MMGANLAADVAQEQLSEAVIGYSRREHGQLLCKLFQRPYFHVTLTPDVVSSASLFIRLYFHVNLTPDVVSRTELN